MQKIEMTPSFEKIKAVTSSVSHDNKKGKKKEAAEVRKDEESQMDS
jgi:hypothetical protein